MATPLMNLDLPVPGPGGTIGPTYATMLNTALNLVDSHDHTTGKGTKVTPAGINVNQNFNFSSFGQYNVNYVKLVDQVATVSDFTSIYSKDGDFYWKNDGGVDVQITLGNTINAAAAGGIGGDYTTSTASVTYSDITKTYTFKQSPTITGDIAAGSLYVYENVVSGKYAKIKVPAGLAGNYDLTLPSGLPATKSLLAISNSGLVTTDGEAVIQSPIDLRNYSIVCSVAASALTIALKTQSNADPSASDKAVVSFRDATATSGLFTQRTITNALSIVVTSGATLGHRNAVNSYIYVYAIDNAGTVELAVSGRMINDRVVQSTTIMNASSDALSIIYSTTARSNCPVRLIARLTSNQTTAGTWASVPTAITLNPDNKEPVNTVESSSSGSFTTTSTTFVDVTNLSATMISSGRPISISLVASNPSNVSYIAVNAAAGSIINGAIRITDATITASIARYDFSYAIPGGVNGGDMKIPPSSVFCIYTPVTGSITIKVEALAGSSDTTIVENVKLLLVEL